MDVYYAWHTISLLWTHYKWPVKKMPWFFFFSVLLLCPFSPACIIDKACICVVLIFAIFLPSARFTWASPSKKNVWRFTFLYSGKNRNTWVFERLLVYLPFFVIGTVCWTINVGSPLQAMMVLLFLSQSHVCLVHMQSMFYDQQGVRVAFAHYKNFRLHFVQMEINSFMSKLLMCAHSSSPPPSPNIYRYKTSMLPVFLSDGHWNKHVIFTLLCY